MNNKAAAGKESGFTLIELIMVIVLLSLLVTVAVRWRSAGESTVLSQAQLLASHLRHIQSLAANQGSPLRLNINSNNYCVTVPPATACTSAITDPSTNRPLFVTLSNAVIFTGTSTTDFDTLGRPKSTAGALLTTNRIMQLQASTKTWSVTLAPLTGFVTVTSP